MQRFGRLFYTKQTNEQTYEPYEKKFEVGEGLWKKNKKMLF